MGVWGPMAGKLPESEAASLSQESRAREDLCLRLYCFRWINILTQDKSTSYISMTSWFHAYLLKFLASLKVGKEMNKLLSNYITQIREPLHQSPIIKFNLFLLFLNQFMLGLKLEYYMLTRSSVIYSLNAITTHS